MPIASIDVTEVTCIFDVVFSRFARRCRRRRERRWLGEGDGKSTHKSAKELRQSSLVKLHTTDVRRDPPWCWV